MANMVDVRIVKTKEKLKKTIVSLLKVKPVDEITISEICSAAGINRNTFYSHYSDVKSLLEEVKAQYLEVFLSDISSNSKYNENFQKFITSILENMRNNIEISKLLFDDQGGEVFLKTVIRFAVPDDLMSLNFESSNISSEDIYQFMIGGIVNLIQVWIHQDFMEKPENIGMKIAFFMQCFKSNFR